MREHAKEGFYILDESQLGAIGRGGLSTGRRKPVEMKGGVMRSRSARLSSFSGFICVRSRIGTRSRAQTGRKPSRQHWFAQDKISADLVAPVEGGRGGGAPVPAVPEQKETGTKAGSETTHSSPVHYSRHGGHGLSDLRSALNLKVGQRRHLQRT